jgi:hypothetical protein
VETGDESDPEKRRIIGPDADRAGVSVRRRGVESAAADVADHERQQQGSRVIRDVDGARPAPFLPGAKRTIGGEVAEVVSDRAEHRLPLRGIDVEQRPLQRRRGGTDFRR